MRRGTALRAVVLILALAAPAAAHSIVLASSPAAGATVAEPPRQLSLRFNNRIEKALSRLRLVNERGEALPLPVPAAEGADDRLTAGVPALAPGTYRVEWRVLSTDGHIVDGSFSFRVAP